jgi:hypothetical protein
VTPICSLLQQIFLPLISPLINQDVRAAAATAHAIVDDVKKGRFPKPPRVPHYTGARGGNTLSSEEPCGRIDGEAVEAATEQILWCWPALREVLLRSCPGQLGEFLSASSGK